MDKFNKPQTPNWHGAALIYNMGTLSRWAAGLNNNIDLLLMGSQHSGLKPINQFHCYYVLHTDRHQ